MPSLAEIRFYLRGIWFLFRDDPIAQTYLDFSNHGVRRSFWALALSYPFMVSSELLSLSKLALNPVQVEMSIVLRSCLIQGLSWMSPLVIIGTICLVSDLPRSFAKIVVVTNWLSLPINVFAAIVILVMATGLQPLSGVMVILLQVVVLAVFLFEVRVLYLLMEKRILPTVASVIGTSAIALIITELGTHYITGT